MLLIIEGVTGAGKSRTIAGLLAWGQRTAHPVHVVDEDVTLGSFLDDVKNADWRAQPIFPGLDAGLAAAERHQSDDRTALVILERFHLSAFALFSHWNHLEPYDLTLQALGAVQVLLDYHPQHTEQRSILRADRTNWAAEMDQHYGSRREAVTAIKLSQAKRRDALLLSQLPYLHLDNSSAHLDDCVAAILAYCGYSRQTCT